MTVLEDFVMQRSAGGGVPDRHDSSFKVVDCPCVLDGCLHAKALQGQLS